MKKNLVILLIFLIIIAAFILFVTDSEKRGFKNEEQRVNLSKLQEDKRLQKQDEERKTYELLEKIEQGLADKFLVPEKSLIIKNDLKKMLPCDFIRKYQEYENVDELWFALVDDFGEDNGQSLFYAKNINYDQIDQTLNELDGDLALELININIDDYLKLPSDYRLVEGTEVYKKAHHVITDKSQALVDNYYSKIDEAIDDIDSNSIYHYLITYNVEIENKYESYEIPIDDWGNPKEEYLLVQLDRMHSVRKEYIKEKAKGKLQAMLIEYDKSQKPINIIPAKMREKYLSLASNSTEIALANLMFNRLKKVNYKNIIDLDKNIKNWNIDYHKKFRSYLTSYVNYMIDNNDATYANKELYQVLSLFDHRLKNKTYKEFIVGKKSILDSIYGEGCDDRQYKDLCTEFCRQLD